jgi:hypothetical protein
MLQYESADSSNLCGSAYTIVNIEKENGLFVFSTLRHIWDVQRSMGVMMLMVLMISRTDLWWFIAKFCE